MSRRKKGTVRATGTQDRLTALTDMGAWEAAIVEARRVIAHQPDDAQAYAQMSRSFLNLKRYDEGLQAADAAIRLDPNREWHHRLRALHLRRLDRYGEALISAREAVRLLPESRYALWCLGNAQSDCLQWTELLRTSRRFERAHPQLESPHHFRGNALWGLGDVEGARAAYLHALSLDPRCADLHADLGHVLLREHRIVEAIECFQRTLRLRPDFESSESSLLYALRGYIDQRLCGHAPGPTHASQSDARLSIQFHLLAMRSPYGYRHMFNAHPPPLAYVSPLPADDADAIESAFSAWRPTSDEDHVRLLTDLGLSADLARSFLEGSTVHYPSNISLDDMLHSWMVTVFDVERGYPRRTEDFDYDRRVRDAIDWIVGEVSPKLAETISSAVAPWDTRFREATMEALTPGAPQRSDTSWWWGRAPVAGGMLACPRYQAELPDIRQDSRIHER